MKNIKDSSQAITGFSMNMSLPKVIEFYDVIDYDEANEIKEVSIMSSIYIRDSLAPCVIKEIQEEKIVVHIRD